MKRFRLSPLLIYYFSFKNKKKFYTKFLLTRDQRKKKKKKLINRIWTNLSKEYIIPQNERDWQPAENLDTLLWMDQLQRIHGQPQIL